MVGASWCEDPTGEFPARRTPRALRQNESRRRMQTTSTYNFVMRPGNKCGEIEQHRCIKHAVRGGTTGSRERELKREAQLHAERGSDEGFGSCDKC